MQGDKGIPSRMSIDALETQDTSGKIMKEYDMKTLLLEQGLQQLQSTLEEFSMNVYDHYMNIAV